MTRPIKHVKINGCADCPWRRPAPMYTGHTCVLQEKLKGLDPPNIEARHIGIGAYPPSWCPQRDIDVKISFADDPTGEAEPVELPSDEQEFAKRMRTRRVIGAT